MIVLREALNRHNPAVVPASGWWDSPGTYTIISGHRICVDWAYSAVSKLTNNGQVQDFTLSGGALPWSGKSGPHPLPRLTGLVRPNKMSLPILPSPNFPPSPCSRCTSRFEERCDDDADGGDFSSGEMGQVVGEVPARGGPRVVVALAE